MTNKLLCCSKSGYPDIIITKQGQTYFFEVKTETGKLSELQRVVHAKLNQHKEIAFVVRSLEEFKIIWGEL
jgi:hypothetical protein